LLRAYLLYFNISFQDAFNGFISMTLCEVLCLTTVFSATRI